MEERFFIDRALGAHLVPSALRRAGWNIVTMRERYGEQQGQITGDTIWIREATAAGECILTKDARVATRPAEAQTSRLRPDASPPGKEAGYGIRADDRSAQTEPQTEERATPMPRAASAYQQRTRVRGETR